jgi:hypothetical protein
MNRRIAAAIPLDVRSHIDKLLVVSESGRVSGFENLKADPGRPGIDNLQSEIAKLRAIRAMTSGQNHLSKFPGRWLQMFKRRATNEKASEMREHPESVRYALMGCFLHVRALELTDDVTRMAIGLIHRFDVRSEKQIHREWLADLERVDGKMQILSTIAEAVTEYPDGIVREVILPTREGGDFPQSGG